MSKDKIPRRVDRIDLEKEEIISAAISGGLIDSFGSNFRGVKQVKDILGRQLREADDKIRAGQDPGDDFKPEEHVTFDLPEIATFNKSATAKENGAITVTAEDIQSNPSFQELENLVAKHGIVVEPIGSRAYLSEDGVPQVALRFSMATVRGADGRLYKSEEMVHDINHGGARGIVKGPNTPDDDTGPSGSSGPGAGP